MILSLITAISLVDVAEYYRGLPHQRQALELLGEQIRATHPNWLTDESEFVATWRNLAETAAVFPRANIVADGEQLQIATQDQTYTISASDLSIFVLDTYDPQTGETVDREMTGERFTDLSINPDTGEIAVGVFLDYFVATTTSAVVIVEPQPDGYSTRVAQRPGSRPLPSDAATYPFSSLSSVRFVSGDLQVTHGDAAGNVALEVFSSLRSPALPYAGCIDLLTIADTAGLCSIPRES